MSRRIIARKEGELHAVVKVPGSKSIANRALLLAGLADGTSTLRNVPDGDDTNAMVESLESLGVKIERKNDVVRVFGPINLNDKTPISLNAKLAGTTSRFLTALAAIREGRTTIDGESPLQNRPNRVLIDALRSVGAEITESQGQSLPVTVCRGHSGVSVLEVDGSISSQFISALMLIGAKLPKGLEVRIRGELVSRSYVQTTSSILKAFGITSSFQGSSVRIASQEVRPTDLEIEPDASSASYPLAAAAIVGGDVTVLGLHSMSAQADAVFAKHLATMGCALESNGSVRVSRQASSEIVGLDVDMSDCSDLVPTLATVCCFATTPSVISGVGFIREKESNRIEGLAQQLRALGGEVEPYEDGLRINPSRMHGGEIDTMHDHRIAMALSLVGLATGNVTINNPDVVAKSWPGYWEMLEHL